MFDFLRNTLLWKQTFDSAFNRGMIFFSKFDGRKLQEKRYHWRERLGREGRGYRPREAAFRAFLEFANDYYSENCDRPDAERDFQDIAFALEFSAPYQDHEGNYKPERSFLSERWLKYLEDYRVRREAEKADRDNKYKEVLSHRFAIEEIESAWQSLLTGNIPPAARSVFLGAYPRSSAHEIAEKTLLPLREVVFWAVLFRINGMMEEAVISDEHFYTSIYARTDPATIREPKASLVARLIAS